MKEAGNSSTQPLRDSLGSGKNWRLIGLALFGMTAGQAVVWYQGQFQALFFLQTTEGLKFIDSYLVVGTAILLGTPFFIFFGWLSDRIGRKPVILSGMALAAITYFPIYTLMDRFSHAVKGADGKVVVGGAHPDILPLILLVFIQIVYVTMVYGPIAAFLVEYFPAKIRYTSLSVPYHLGNGWFGGFLPLIAASLAAATGNKYAGLIYPITIAVISIIIGGLFIRETFRNRIWDEVGGEHEPPVTGTVTPA